MERAETKQILFTISSLFPNFKSGAGEERTAMINAWHMILKDYDAKDVLEAVRIYSATDRSGFAPSVGQVIASIKAKEEYGELSGMEAWSLVMKALRNSSTHSKEEFAKLPKLVQKTVGSPMILKQWSMTEDVERYVQERFLKDFDAVKSRERQVSSMPADVRALIHKTEEQMPQIETAKAPETVEENRTKRESPDWLKQWCNEKGIL